MIDLHAHSTTSDGTLTPTEVVRHAFELGIDVMALTDHDTVLGVEEALAEADRINESARQAEQTAAAQDGQSGQPDEQSGEQSRRPGRSITVIPGIEISAGYGKRDVHILGYYVDHRHETFRRMLDAAVEERDERNELMAERFRAAGIPMTIEEVRELGRCLVVTRAHMAHWLCVKGYAADNKDAFKRYLDYDKPFFVPRRYMSRQKAVETILEAGGVPVLAHPMIYGLGADELERLVAELKSYGLKGLETYYSSNMNNDEDRVRHLAIKYGLIMTGGSDFHGANKPGLEMGRGYGNLRIPYSCYEALKKAAGR